MQYTVRLVFKSSKFIPTMVVSTFSGNAKPFSWAEYVAAFLLCFGVGGFYTHSGKTDVAGGMMIAGIYMLLVAMGST